MQPKSSRRQFMRNTAAASLTALLPKGVVASACRQAEAARGRE